MPRRMFFFDPPDRFVAGTVGEPGQRTFFIQARKAGQVVSVVLEKIQVQVLAERLDQLLDELEERGITPASDGATVDSEPLDEPLVEAFRATTLTLGWDVDAERVLVEARAEPVEIEIEAAEDDDEDESRSGAGVAPSAEDEPEGEVAATELDASLAASIIAAFEQIDEEEGPDVLRVRVPADAARSFVARAARVVAAGRPPCPLCGQPLDPQGHLCPRRNGHYVN
ncbi:MAG TPA: DUF3090 family protein [Candidatus Limnocylindrales bacterium]|nr:DUF3090 family protein [Candidatus Limnocylindrales bacterium]